LSAENADFFVTTMPLTKAQKQKIIENLKEKIARQRIMIFVDFTGLKVKDLSGLRRQLKKTDGEIKVAKKTLLRIAFKEKNLELDTKKLSGEIALVFGYQDIILPTKTTWQFSLANPNLKILGGFLESKFVETEKIIELAKLPTREELLAKLVGSISAPISNLVNVLQGNIRNFVYIISQIKPST